MSLLITKSPAGKPNSYQNHFKETFEIKPHSQIAVQEVTLHRRNLFNIGDGYQSALRSILMSGKSGGGEKVDIRTLKRKKSSLRRRGKNTHTCWR